jgi:SAM-dependent methyltransferase
MTGIAGINSLILAREGIRVALQLEEPAQAAYAAQVWQLHAPESAPTITYDADFSFPDESYDLVWNFNVLTRVPDPAVLLADMARISRRLVFFCVPNAGNYSFWLHRWHHKVAKEPWHHGDIAWMRPAPWLDLLSDSGLRLCEILYVDCPWWPDIVDLGQLIADFVPVLKRAARTARPENRFSWEPEGLPYFEPERYPGIHAKMARWAFFEKSPHPWVKRLFGHHIGFIAEKI